MLCDVTKVYKWLFERFDMVDAVDAVQCLAVNNRLTMIRNEWRTRRNVVIFFCKYPLLILTERVLARKTRKEGHGQIDKREKTSREWRIRSCRASAQRL